MPCAKSTAAITVTLRPNPSRLIAVGQAGGPYFEGNFIKLRVSPVPCSWGPGIETPDRPAGLLPKLGFSQVFRTRRCSGRVIGKPEAISITFVLMRGAPALGSSAVAEHSRRELDDISACTFRTL
jgi:hypothetical protein